jgi:ABC-type tungstate transport system substrate-binding protein
MLILLASAAEHVIWAIAAIGSAVFANVDIVAVVVSRLGEILRFDNSHLAIFIKRKITRTAFQWLCTNNGVLLYARLAEHKPLKQWVV